MTNMIYGTNTLSLYSMGDGQSRNMKYKQINIVWNKTIQVEEPEQKNYLKQE